MKSKKLPKIGLGISASGLGISVTLFLLVFLEIVPVEWDAEALPNCTMFLVVPFCIVGLVVSIVSAIVHRDLLSVLGIVLGFLATIASLLALLAIGIAAAARHPV